MTRYRRCLTRGLVLLALSMPSRPVTGQDAPPASRLEAAWVRLSAEPTLYAASIGIHVAEAATGRPVFDRNGRAALIPASSQKLLTAAAALELLGTSYRYETEFLLSGKPSGGSLSGPLVVRGGGDPTLGGSRFPSQSPDRIAAHLREALARVGVTSLRGGVAGLADASLSQTIPDGWMWEDIGNYYGAGHGSLNWNENRYSLLLRPGVREGNPVGIVSTEPPMPGQSFDNALVTGPKGSGDRAVLYFSPNSDTIVARGSVPCCGGVFRISGAVRDPVRFTVRQLGRTLGAGEAMVRSLSRQAGGDGSYADGLDRLRDFWVAKGIDPRMLALRDGSGLSPTNRVSAEALVQALLHARRSTWFPAFDRAMPVHDGIRMKSGTMGGVRSYAGYLKGRDGRDYVFAVIVNHFTGPGSATAERIRRFIAAIR